MMLSLSQGSRFIANGLVATAAHYAVLALCMEVWRFDSASLSSLLASCAGITLSFLGNRFFVFRSTDETLLRQALRFMVLYAAIALLHGAVLHAWTDVNGWSYQTGFALATLIQVSLSYMGGKHLVFRRPPADVPQAQRL